MKVDKSVYHIIGLMSGTSLDGLDIAYCQFIINNKKIDFTIVYADTIEYSSEWKQYLLSLESANAVFFNEADRKIGQFFGENVRKFIQKYEIEELDFVSSHGHTIFHQPEKNFTVQVGHGAALAAACGYAVVCDFRSKDVALGGQGAPLVPIGDQLLFENYQFCLNLGGFANISFTKNNQLLACDIVPANIVLNALAQKLGHEYDDEGSLAASGNIISDLLSHLDELAFYENEAPKSLGNEWVLREIFPILEKYNHLAVIDILATFCEHISNQISKIVLKNLPTHQDCKMLATGGGAFNTFLIAAINKKLAGKCSIIIPSEKTVKFKEALIFALLGLLRTREERNCIKSVTGASIDNIGGCIYL
ncbi:MAG: anhydro-N-acetylmuramic acid kinase [Cytophagales bacterium]